MIYNTLWDYKSTLKDSPEKAEDREKVSIRKELGTTLETKTVREGSGGIGT